MKYENRNEDIAEKLIVWQRLRLRMVSAITVNVTQGMMCLIEQQVFLSSGIHFKSMQLFFEIEVNSD